MIRFEDVTKVYDRGSKPALKNVSVEIERGEFVFLVGASGSGKSTFIRLIQREETATSGKVHVIGRDVAKLPSWRVPLLRRELGVVFQDFRLLANKTVFANVSFAMQVLGRRKALINQYVPEVLKMVGLEGKEKRLPHELSGGEQQRVAIARAAVNRPAILLADEPTGNLDPETSWGIMDVLDRIHQNGTTVVMATHNYDVVNTLRQRVIELRDGEVVRDEQNAEYHPTDTQLHPILAGGQASEARARAVITSDATRTDTTTEADPGQDFSPRPEPENEEYLDFEQDTDHEAKAETE